MDDLISRQAAIEALRKAYWDKDIQSAKDDPCIVDAMTDWAIRQIKAVPSVQPKSQWIPCSERLPKKYIGQWLCCTSDGDVMILPYDTPGDGTKECVFYEWDDDGYFYQTFDVIAWMPLPEPWKGESDG